METIELKNIIENNEAVLLYFFNDNCPPCKALRPKVEDVIHAKFPKMKSLFINAAQFPQTSADFSIFESPTLIAFFDGRENFRKSKYVSMAEFEHSINRYYQLIFQE